MAFHTAAHSSAKPLSVAVSIPPQKYFAERIGGPLVDVTVLAPPGADPHSYEPRPRQIIGLSRARIYFAVGVPFEDAWLPRIRSANPKLIIVRTDRGIRKIPMASHDHANGAHHGEDKGGLDVHVWLSPPLVRTIAEAMRDALVDHDAANAETYQKNCDKFTKEIDALHAHLETLFSQVGDQNKFMVFHPSWGYFAQAYHLVQAPVEIEGKEPKPAEIMRLVKLARAEGIGVIFVQPRLSARSARTIADAIGGKIVLADDLAEDWDRNLRTVAAQLKNALR